MNEAFFGPFKRTETKKCTACEEGKGWRFKDGTNIPEDCPTCQGTGRVAA